MRVSSSVTCASGLVLFCASSSLCAPTSVVGDFDVGPSQRGNTTTATAPLLQASGKVNALKSTVPNASAASSVGYDYVQVVTQATKLAANSWEYGAVAQALLEVYDGPLSVFGSSNTAFPNSKIPVTSNTATSLAYAKPLISTHGTTLVQGQGATGDPASLGVAAIMLGQKDSSFLQAAARQANHLLTQVPRYGNGAISHRENVAELWADFVYMAPPFLAYYAVQTSNVTLMKQVVNQCSLYRQVLQAPASSGGNGLWRHIVGPQSQTLGLWATGNAWSALGMVRVLATMKNWPRTAAWSSYPDQLAGYIYEIFDGVLATATNQETGRVQGGASLVRNYMLGGANGPTPASGSQTAWFGDAAGTAGLAAAMYRMAVLQPTKAARYLPWADAARRSIAKAVNPSNGIVAPVVNPYDWFDSNPYNQGSPEGQAFAAMLGAAYIDCKNAKVCA